MGFWKWMSGGHHGGGSGGHHGGWGRHGGGHRDDAHYGRRAEPEGRRCLNCGAFSAAGAKFCQACGVSFVAAACRQCNAAVEAGARFCGQCGATVA